MKINWIREHRKSDFGVQNWTIEVEDHNNFLYQWLLDTFKDEEYKHVDQTEYWRLMWSGKQYHNKRKRQYHICGREIMSMIMLRWA